MKIEISKVKRGTILDIEGKLCKVLDISHTHTGRQGGTYSFKVRDIVNGGTKNVGYKSGVALEKADVSTNNAIFLYSAGDTYVFMESDSSEMHELNEEDVDDVKDYLKENLDVFLMIHEGNVLGVILPATITYKVVKTVPGVKGNRSTSGKKPATLETGLEVMVSLHIEEGEEVILNTATGEITK